MTNPLHAFLRRDVAVKTEQYLQKNSSDMTDDDIHRYAEQQTRALFDSFVAQGLEPTPADLGSVATGKLRALLVFPTITDDMRGYRDHILPKMIVFLNTRGIPSHEIQVCTELISTDITLSMYQSKGHVWSSHQLGCIASDYWYPWTDYERDHRTYISTVARYSQRLWSESDLVYKSWLSRSYQDHIHWLWRPFSTVHAVCLYWLINWCWKWTILIVLPLRKCGDGPIIERKGLQTAVKEFCYSGSKDLIALSPSTDISERKHKIFHGANTEISLSDHDKKGLQSQMLKGLTSTIGYPKAIRDTIFSALLNLVRGIWSVFTIAPKLNKRIERYKKWREDLGSNPI